jgi:mannosyl-3-phosphoglycerate phosphatase family protein
VLILLTDLDGSLLEESSYSPEPAREALHRIRGLGLPLVFCTSKTRAEVEHLRSILSNEHPFITENGGALFVPDGYFRTEFDTPSRRDTYVVYEFGTPYNELVTALHRASQQTGCRVRGFHDMNPDEVSRRYGLSLEQSRLAKIREYDEPFEILDPPGSELLAAIEALGKHWTRGGRLHHITGHGNKDHSVNLLASCYRRAFGDIITVGLGDGMNDLDFLSCVDVPVIIRSKAAEELRSLLPRARLTDLAGPAGWNRAVLELLDEHAAELKISSGKGRGG